MRRVDELKASRFSRQLWIDEVTDPLAFARLRAEWNGLHRRSRQAPFLAWEWLYPWWRRVRPWAALRVFVIRDSTGHLRAILPLCETMCRGARRWGFLGDGEVGSDGLDLICLPEERAEMSSRARQLYLDRYDYALAMEKYWAVMTEKCGLTKDIPDE